MSIYGYDTYVHKLSQTITKVDPKNTKCIFIWYHQNAKVYILIDLETSEPIIGHDVIFNEGEKIISQGKN